MCFSVIARVAGVQFSVAFNDQTFSTATLAQRCGRGIKRDADACAGAALVRYYRPEVRPSVRQSDIPCRRRVLSGAASAAAAVAAR